MTKSPAAWGLFLLGVSAIVWVGVQAWYRQASLALQRDKLQAKMELEETQRADRQTQSLENLQREENLETYMMNARRQCHDVAEQNARSSYQSKMRNVNEFSLRTYGRAAVEISPTMYYKDDYEMLYQQCLRQLGIE